MQVQSTTPSSEIPAAKGESLSVSWLMPLGIVGLAIYNFVLRILTLGIYHFWGKTEVRKRIWSAIRINGEPLEYTGTGRELLLGFLIIFAIVLLPVLLLTIAVVVMFGAESNAMKIFQVALYAAFLYLTGIAIYRAQRYRLARTRWRGIRAGLSDNGLTYGWTYFWTMILLPFTLGWLAPWRSNRLQAIITNDMRFGDQPFRFSASSGPLYKSFALFWVLCAILAFATLTVIGTSMAGLFGAVEDGELPAQIPPDKIVSIIALVYGALFAAGLIYMVLSAWYRAAMIRHFAGHTHFDGVTFRSTVNARGLLWYTVTNYLMLFAGAFVGTLVLSGIAFLILAGLSSVGIDPLGMGGDALPSEALKKLIGPATLLFLLSLGMLLPLAQARTSGYLIRNLSLDGMIDTEAISAGAEQHMTRGEGLAQAFDIDAL